MKFILTIISISTFSLLSLSSIAIAQKNIQKNSQKNIKMNSQKNDPVVRKKISTRTTDAHFTGANVHGKYSHSPESVVSVENEKKLISVVSPRNKLHFQLKKSLEELK